MITNWHIPVDDPRAVRRGVVFPEPLEPWNTLEILYLLNGSFRRESALVATGFSEAGPGYKFICNRVKEWRPIVETNKVWLVELISRYKRVMEFEEESQGIVFVGSSQPKAQEWIDKQKKEKWQYFRLFSWTVDEE